ncbi:carbohydrate-binding module family 13 protein [Cylindrobasidium torrendii FP15055 ss-10]|uniref:Carbohydrate-binding module family 13 protein n=1 Tax=Cylindrobasidium torrendii FP15055 ss-10 TaxID=1314674 RepID=A0A0D7B097_9AGAR|nr:carbohydrate-binding module family 13 protein [Cylindrobasidium torrendii FP15055 ss-10]
MLSYLQALSVLAAAGIVMAADGKPNVEGPVYLHPALDFTKCLTAIDNADGGRVGIQDCSGGLNQEWTFSGLPGNVRTLRTPRTDKCLDVVDGVNADGTHLQVWNCSPLTNENQNFYYTDDNHLAWTDHGKCLDLTDGNTAADTLVQLWTCGSGINQVWYVDPAAGPSTTYTSVRASPTASASA